MTQMNDIVGFFDMAYVNAGYNVDSLKNRRKQP